MRVCALLLSCTVLTAAQADNLLSTPGGRGLSLAREVPALSVPADGSELLNPQQAFLPLLTAVAPNRLRAEWAIAEGYYLYRDKFAFTARTAGIELGTAQLPPGQSVDDEFYGQVEVYRGQVSVELPLYRTGDAPTDIDIELVYQGCAEVGVCFLPQSTVLPVHLVVSGNPR